jgi:hypothetical protein
MGGIVDEDVDAAELADAALDERAAVSFLRDVASHRDGAASRLAHPPRRLLGVLVLAEIGDQHVGALAREGDRHGASDPRIRPGDQRHPPFELAGPFVAVLAMIRLGPHLVRRAGRRLLLGGLGRLGPGILGVGHRLSPRGRRGTARRGGRFRPPGEGNPLVRLRADGYGEQATSTVDHPGRAR